MTTRNIWLLPALIAVGAGIYWRITGLGLWPLADDEFFLFRSMELFFEQGLPRFPCGGYYNRGVIVQLLGLPLIGAGVSPELVVRSLTVIGSLLALPAAYLLARRLSGPLFGAIILVILALSAWEIEMARFGRMYAPFQAVFLWYVYHAVRLVGDGDKSRWRWLFALSLAGPLVWEGGIVLAFCNFLPMLMDRKHFDNRHLVSAFGLALIALVYASINFRFVGSLPYQTPADPAAVVADPGIWQQFAAVAFPSLQAGAMAAISISAAAVLTAFVLLRNHARRPLPWLSLLSMAVLTLLVLSGQLLLAGFVFTGALALAWLRSEDLFSAPHRNWLVLLIASGLLVIGLTVLMNSDTSLTTRLRGLIGFPDLLYKFVYPWLAVMPVLTLFLGMAIAATVALLLFQPDKVSPSHRYLLLILLLSLFMVTAAPTPYRETRYSFFVYPALLCMAGLPLSWLVSQLAGDRKAIATALPAALMLLVFLFSNDADFRHLGRIASYDANFRIGYPQEKQQHFYIRTDYRTAADYVNARIGVDDRVIATAVALTQYLDRVDYVFMDYRDRRARGQICSGGARERWSGLPLLGGVEGIADIVENAQGAVWVIEDMHLAANSKWQQFISSDMLHEVVFETGGERLKVYRFRR